MIDKTLGHYRVGEQLGHGLKPANVMITEGDGVKTLDFGLAKALSAETQAGDLSQSPTITEAMTQPGIVLGAAQRDIPSGGQINRGIE